MNDDMTPDEISMIQLLGFGVRKITCVKGKDALKIEATKFAHRPEEIKELGLNEADIEMLNATKDK